jgi:hypothetical protein
LDRLYYAGQTLNSGHELAIYVLHMTIVKLCWHNFRPEALDVHEYLLLMNPSELLLPTTLQYIHILQSATVLLLVWQLNRKAPSKNACLALLSFVQVHNTYKKCYSSYAASLFLSNLFLTFYNRNIKS